MSLVLSQHRPLSTNEAAEYCADHLVRMAEPKLLWSSFNLCLLSFLCFSARTGLVLLSLTHDTGGTQANFLALPTLLMAVDWARLQKPLCPPNMSMLLVCFPFPPSSLYSSHATVKDSLHFFQRSLSLKIACAFSPRSGVPFGTLTAYYTRCHMIPIAGLS